MDAEFFCVSLINLMKSVQPKGEFCYHEGHRGHPFHCRAVEDERLWSALMVQVAEGDEHALTRSYDGTNRMVYGLALRILGDSSAAEDVTLECLFC